MSDKLEALRLEAETLSGLMHHLANDDIGNTSFAVMSDLGENGTEHECDLDVGETALRAASVIDQLLAALEEKDARTAACVNAFEGIETERIAGKNLGEFLAGEVRLNKAEPKPDGSFGFTFSGFAVQIMAEAFAEQFRAADAVNYLELLFQHDELGPLTVTMQRVEGLTPAQKLAAAEQRAEAAEQALKLEQEQSAYYERHMWNFHGLAESESQRAEAAERKYRDEFAKRVIDEVVDADPRQIMGKGRIREISEGADVLVGEKVLLAKTALYYIEKNREAIEGFQRAGLLLVDQQEHNEELEQRLQQPIKLPDIRSEDYHESGWFQHMKYYRDVVRSIQALELKVEGE